MLLPKYALLAFLIISFISCSDSEGSNESEFEEDDIVAEEEVEIIDTTTSEIEEPKAKTREQFLESLEKRELLADYFQENWYFIYHKDHRCEGITTGEAGDLAAHSIDFIILFEVHNDGNGWMCEKTEPSTYEFEFDLDRELDKWDRFELVESEMQHPDVAIIEGAGASDYIKLNYEDGLINTLEYYSEDPG